MSEDKQTRDKSGGKELFPVLPLRDIVVFPYMIVPLFVGREKSIAALEEVMRSDKLILLAAQKNAGDDDPATDAIYEMGTLASVLQLLKLPDGTVKVLVEGTHRAKIKRYTDNTDFFEAEVERVNEDIGAKDEIEALARSAVSQFENYVKLNKKISPEVLGTISQIDDYSKLADTIASHLAIKISDKQEVLEVTTISERLERVYTLMESEISVLQVEKKIRSRVKRQMEKTQREYYLNEQMKAIQKELGDTDERDDIAEFEEKIENTKLSKEARDKALAELKKLRQMSPMSAEATVVRNYLDWLLSIPWGVKGKVKKDLDEAQATLDAEHYGLEKVKERIVEYLAVQARTNKLKGPDPLPRRPARRRQDLARQVDRQRDRPRVRAHVARRRARRGRDPRSPPHLHRLDARQGHPVDEEGQAHQPALPSRRDRQDGHRLPRRSRSGAAGGAGPRAELYVQRSLPRGRLRSLERDVRDDGEHAQHPAGPHGPHGDHPPRRLHGDEKVEIAKRHLIPEQTPGARPRGRANGRSRRRRCRRSSAATRARPACARSSASWPSWRARR